MANIDDDDNGNALNGTSGSDTISGNGGNDTINGGDGDDTLYGGDGDDVIAGGSGQDVIVGGRGNDTMTASSGSTSDTFVIRDGDGSDTITDFDPGEPDIVQFDMVEITNFQDVLDRMSTDGNDTIITFDNGDTLRLSNVNQGDLSSTNFQYGAGPVCLVAGTLIETPSGARPVEALRAGDLVMTVDHGAQPILHVIRQVFDFRPLNDRRKPILIAKGALGPGRPNAAIAVSPQHRFVVSRSPVDEEVLIPAVKLIHRKGIRRMRGKKAAQYINLLMERHEIIYANGCLVETMLMTPYSAQRMSRGHFRCQSGMISARPIVARDPLLEPGSGRDDPIRRPLRIAA